MNLSEFLLSQTNRKRAIEQRHARTLLFEGIGSSSDQKEQQFPQIKNLLDQLSDATDVFFPEPVQQEIYSADTGTHIMPEIFKNLLADIKLAFVIRPGCVEDLQRFITWAGENRCNYTVRGAGTYPFGGCVPLKDDIVVDLSYLDFLDLDEEHEALLIGAGVLFPDARKYLQERGYALRQETTNRSSGTIAGWIATGGIGLGSFKYRHVKESVLELMIIQPDGELVALRPGDEAFDYYFGSEGQFGIIVGAALRVRKESFVQRPFAFSFQSGEDAHQFMAMLYDAKLNPTSIIYFDPSYLAQTYQIEKEHIEHRSSEALKTNDQLRLADAREDYDLIEEIKDQAHVIVLHFDEAGDYQQALKSRLFGSGGEQRRVNHLSYRQLTTAMAHLLWEHRFLPVQMKQKGPSLLVSETILPFAAFPAYQNLLRKIFDKVFDIELKYEAHLLPNHEILVQSIFLADTRTFRHKIYFALVPLMAQVAHYFGAKPYGIGMWNYFFMKKWRQVYPERAAQLAAFKKQSDPQGLINQGKFLNPKGQKLAFKMLKIITPALSQWFVSTYHKRIEGKRLLLSYPLEKLVWKLIQIVFPRIVPPHLKANGKNPILEMISVCAECDSCERVCPTSDVFGLYGPATPITRRLTAHRIATNQPISQREAYGFLACTRCDNCNHICPTNINLTKVFDLVEADERFQQVLNFAVKTIAF